MKKSAITEQEMLSFLDRLEREAARPEIPEALKFPFIVVAKRKKLSERNNHYLAAFLVRSLSDFAIMSRNLKHKGYPVLCIMFEAPGWMIERQEQSNRFLWYRFQNWKDLSRWITPAEKMIIPDLEQMFPCPATQIKMKTGQFKLIF
jgi:hypothetical protein